MGTENTAHGNVQVESTKNGSIGEEEDDDDDDSRLTTKKDDSYATTTTTATIATSEGIVWWRISII